MGGIFQMGRDKGVLTVIDVQGALVKAMDPRVVSQVIRNVQVLITFAKDMGIPILVTEQYPKGLGGTIPEIKETLEEILPIEKMAFSCCNVDVFNERLTHLGRKQILLCGMEAHVCVLQTTADLLERGYDVHVVADAICSRRKLDWDLGLRWMEKKGAMILSTEIIAFQLLKEAGTDEFKRLSRFLR